MTDNLKPIISSLLAEATSKPGYVHQSQLKGGLYLFAKYDAETSLMNFSIARRDQRPGPREMITCLADIDNLPEDARQAETWKWKPADKPGPGLNHLYLCWPVQPPLLAAEAATTNEPDKILCPVCRGQGGTPAFIDGTRDGKRTGWVQVIPCLTCKGRKYITPQQAEKIRQGKELQQARREAMKTLHQMASELGLEDDVYLAMERGFEL